MCRVTAVSEEGAESKMRSYSRRVCSGPSANHGRGFTARHEHVISPLCVLARTNSPVSPQKVQRGPHRPHPTAVHKFIRYEAKVHAIRPRVLVESPPSERATSMRPSSHPGCPCCTGRKLPNKYKSSSPLLSAAGNAVTRPALKHRIRTTRTTRLCTGPTYHSHTMSTATSRAINTPASL